MPGGGQEALPQPAPYYHLKPDDDNSDDGGQLGIA